MSRPKSDLSVSGIYEIVNMQVGKRYIGSAVNIAARWRKHLYQLRQGKHHAAYLQRSFKTYGEDAFEVHMLEAVLDRERLIEREQYWINALLPEYNSNPTAGSRLGSKVSETTKATLREYNLRPEVIAKKKAELAGHPVAPETIEKIKAARAKQVTSEAQKAALLASAKRTKAEGRTSPGTTGKRHSDEHKRKIAAAHTGMTASPEAREKMRIAKLGRKRK